MLSMLPQLFQISVQLPAFAQLLSCLPALLCPALAYSALPACLPHPALPFLSAPPPCQVTARRLMESKQQVPHYYLTISARVDRLQQLRCGAFGGGTDTSE